MHSSPACSGHAVVAKNPSISDPLRSPKLHEVHVSTAIHSQFLLLLVRLVGLSDHLDHHLPDRLHLHPFPDNTLADHHKCNTEDLPFYHHFMEGTDMHPMDGSWPVGMAVVAPQCQVNITA
jgi:hypothetical protein